jgi:flagellar motor switch protein FliG
MTQEELKVMVEVAKDVKNVPNNRLEQTMDQLAEEFETTKQNILGLSLYLDKVEELYNTILKEYQNRNAS